MITQQNNSSWSRVCFSLSSILMIIYPDNHDGVISHLEPDIPECEVKWALGPWPITMNKATGSDGIPVELIQILNESAALNMPANLENSAVATGQERPVFIPISKKGNAKECSN